VTSAASLDRDEDGADDLQFAVQQGTDLVMTSVQSSDGAEVSATLPGAYAAPADYDGDGVPDFAAVAVAGGKSTWSIQRSSTGEVSTVQFGTGVTGLLYGCKLLGRTKASLGVISKGKVIAMELDGQVTRTIQFGKAKIIGCGDVDLDGVSELIYQREAKTKKRDEFGILPCTKNFVPYVELPKFSAQLAFDGAGVDFPLLVGFRGSRLNVTTLTEIVSFPAIPVRKGSLLSGGTFVDDSGDLEPALLWQDKLGDAINRQFLDGDDTASSAVVRAATDGLRLVAPRGIYSIK